MSAMCGGRGNVRGGTEYAGMKLSAGIRWGVQCPSGAMDRERNELSVKTYE